MRDYFGFDEEEREAIKKLILQCLEQGRPIESMFPGNTPLSEEASMLYLQMKGATFIFGAKPQGDDPQDQFVGRMPPPQSFTSDLSVFASTIENQGSYNSCGPNSLVGMIELLDIKAKKPRIDWSRMFSYFVARDKAGETGQDGGVYNRALMSSFKEYGICPEPMYPYSGDNLLRRPPAPCYSEALRKRPSQVLALKRGDVDKVRSLLGSGSPVLVAIWVFPELMSAETMTTGIMPMPSDLSTRSGGHDILIVGHDDKKERFKCRNSWGQFWGQKGYFYIPYEFYADHSWDPWTITI